ncbi:MAG TPA: peptidoglycan-binding domain-containing protein [Candidatus Paceibacterota bacterium]|nr:peptidoglycan-binding domain-containing protein [Candidatus Paceibacterota bacterium]
MNSKKLPVLAAIATVGLMMLAPAATFAQTATPIDVIATAPVPSGTPGTSTLGTMSIADLQAFVQKLLAQIKALEAQRDAMMQHPSDASSTAAMPRVTTSSTPCPVFARNLTLGSTGPDVTNLQTALQNDGLNVPVTGTFDASTSAAVSGFQRQFSADILAPAGLTTGTGFFGAATRAKINALGLCHRLPPPFPFPMTTTTAPGAPGTMPVVPPINVTVPGMTEVSGTLPAPPTGSIVPIPPPPFHPTSTTTGEPVPPPLPPVIAPGSGQNVPPPATLPPVPTPGPSATNGAPAAALKFTVNGAAGTVTLRSGYPITLVWASTGTTGCSISYYPAANPGLAGTTSVDPNGTATMTAPTVSGQASYVYAFACGANGTKLRAAVTATVLPPSTAPQATTSTSVVN